MPDETNNAMGSGLADDPGQPKPAPLGLTPPLISPPPAEPPPLPALPSLPRSTEPGIVELGIGLAIIWGFDLLIGGIAGVAMILSKKDMGLDNPFELDLGPGAILVTSLLSWAVMLTVCWFLLCRKFKRSFADGFAIRRVGITTMGWSIILGIAGAVAATLLVVQFGKGDSMMAKLGSTPFGFAVLTMIALGAPLVEEVYYRGFLLVLLQRYLKGWAVPLVAAWFAAVHIPQLIGDWVGVPVILVMGFIWTWQRYKTGSLLPGIITHWLYNFCQIAFALLPGSQ
jgi:membrane protease YdiL (CAAX protease family)